MPRWKSATMEHAPPERAWCDDHKIFLTKKDIERHHCIDPEKQKNPGGICKNIIFHGDRRDERLSKYCFRCGKLIGKRETFMVVNGGIVICMDCWLKEGKD